MAATKVAVVGAGSWGTAVAALTAEKVPTVLWARRAEVAEELERNHRNSDYLPDVALPPSLRATHELSHALDGATVVVMAVPSHGFRSILEDARPFIASGVPVISLSKGIETTSLKRMTEVIADVLGDACPAGVLTGPNLAKEVLAGHPAASVVAVRDDGVSRELQLLFSTETFRVYTNPDVVGCEVGGAFKNVIAIAAGMVDGMGLGDNTKAALLTRGLAELARLGVALGGHPLTFSGLAGMGDLIATCSSSQSRNRYVGEQLGQGRTLDEIVAEMRMVAEGVKTSRAVCALAEQVGVEVPIAAEVVEVLSGRKRAADVIPSLMRREAKPELHGITA